jgi:hypothetical protein
MTSTSAHLSKRERVELGSFYTPPLLVNKVMQLIKPYIQEENCVILDNAAGFGVFLKEILGGDYRAADCDLEAIKRLQKNFDKEKIFLTNSLEKVDRSKYNIPEDSFLIMVGNPPYNDRTSEFRSGKKGSVLCDEDLKDRDMGISFLKSYAKLNAEVVCVLHPLSYLIKEANFKRLKRFKDNYVLKKGILFSSALFSGTGSIKFPIVIALYEKSSEGMDYKYIRDFSFSVLESNNKFKLSRYETTDGYINKYPPRKYDAKTSPIGLYFYTFRDLNSLRKNRSFMNEKHYNGIVVTLENFYQYAYLDSLKELFKPEGFWKYGNLSPLVDKEYLEKNKELFVGYVVQKDSFKQLADEKLITKICTYYGIRSEELKPAVESRTDIEDYLETLL